LYRSPVERPHELAEIYGREAPATDALRAMHATQRPSYREQARTLRAVLGRGGSGLEVGSYVGAFLAVAREGGLHMEGIDINPEVNAFTRSLGHVVHDATLETFQSGRAFDAVAIWNTFDQLAEPRGALIAAHRLLRPDGVIALRVPNGAFYAAWRRRMFHGAAPLRATARALLAQNNLLTFPYRAGFTIDALTRLLDATGFDVVHTRGDVLVPISDEWTRPWARLEERATKRALLGAIQIGATPPWVEVYARRRESPAA
jgi:SAM-dependent methyltransferase